MKSLSKIKRESERITGESASIKYDEYTGPHIEVTSEETIPMEKLDAVCEQTGALMKVEGEGYLGEYTYLFR
jgi:hypothetical protein